MSYLKQIVAVSYIAILGMRNRIGMTLSSGLSIAFVMIVLIGFLAMASGFSQTISSGGSKDVAIILSEGAKSELTSTIDANALAIVETAPGVARRNGTAIVSAENYVVVSARRKGTTEDANITLRGVGKMGLNVRPQMRLVEGHVITPGTNEILVGKSIKQGFSGFNLGEKIKLGPVEWTVVGFFDAGGSVLDSEVWADNAVVASVFTNQARLQSLHVALSGPEGMSQLKSHVARNPTLKLSVMTEADHFASQAKGIVKIIKFVGWPLSIAMAIGALAGALNAMFASIAARRQEIATLRIIGFSGFSVFVSTVAEAVFISLCGAAVGVLISFALLDGMQGNTMSGNFTRVGFQLNITGDAIVACIVVAIMVGLLGSIMPAWKASRQKINEAIVQY